jgi:predicted CopG family antitoxin
LLLAGRTDYRNHYFARKIYAVWRRKSKGKSYLLTIVTILLMLAAKRIPVTENVWVELSALKKAGQTYSQLLEEMIEDRKKARLFRDMEKIEEEGEFVEFPW